MRLRTRALAGVTGRHRIAVVDDDATLLKSTKRLLELDGHDVRTATDLRGAVELVRTFRPTLLLLDYYLEQGTGERVLQEIRSFDTLCQVLLVTGYAADQPARKLLADLDIQGYHDKSDGPQRLLVLVDSALKHARALHRLDEQQRQLRHILELAPLLSRMQPVEQLLETALTGLATVLRGGDGLIATSNSGLFVFGAAAEGISIHAATGRFAGMAAMTQLPLDVGVVVRDAMSEGGAPVEVPGYVVVPLCTTRGDRGCMVLEGGHLSADAFEPCAIYARQVTQALENILLYERATIDALTRLCTRGHGMQRLDDTLRLAARTGSAVSVAMIDVDHFKRINDSFGHAAGDLALRNIAEAIRSSCRVTDIAVRYGGEEVLVVLPATDARGAGIIAERMRQEIEAAQFVFEGHVLRATASIGVATASLDTLALPPHELVKLADRALYRAKAQGRNRVCSDHEGGHAHAA